MRNFTIAIVLAACLAGCGPKAPSQSASSAAPAAPAPVEKPMSDAERALRAQAGTYYFDFAKNPDFKRFTPSALGIAPKAAKRFERAIATATPAVIVSAGGVDALVLSGCVQHNCADTIGVLAIELSAGETFVGLKDETGTVILKPSPRLQKLLEDTSPSHEWTNPKRG